KRRPSRNGGLPETAAFPKRRPSRNGGLPETAAFPKRRPSRNGGLPETAASEPGPHRELVETAHLAPRVERVVERDPADLQAEAGADTREVEPLARRQCLVHARVVADADADGLAEPEFAADGDVAQRLVEHGPLAVVRVEVVAHHRECERDVAERLRDADAEVERERVAGFAERGERHAEVVDRRADADLLARKRVEHAEVGREGLRARVVDGGEGGVDGGAA